MSFFAKTSRDINKCSRKTSPNVANNYKNVISRVLGFSKTPKIEKTVKNRKPNGQFPDVGHPSLRLPRRFRDRNGDQSAAGGLIIGLDYGAIQ